MSIRFQVHPDLGVTLFVFEGDVDAADQVAAYRRYVEDGGYDPSFHVIVDQTACNMPTASFDEACYIAAQLRPLLQSRTPESQTVCVCPEDDQYASERIYAGVSEYHLGRAPLVCRSWGEAFAALGLEASKFDAVLADLPRAKT